MKSFIETLKNIWRIEDLRRRILTTLGFLLIYRLGTHVCVPGIDPNLIGDLGTKSQEGIMGLLDLFSGGALSRASIFTMGIMPYISASIVIQLLGMAIPYFQRLQREGESGRKKINQITRYLTVLIAAGGAPNYIRMWSGPNGFIPEEAFILEGPLFFFIAILIMVAGTLFIMWMGEKITDKGIGNGISLIIMIGIIARLPGSLLQEITSKLESSAGGLVVLLVEMVLLFIIFIAVIALVQGTRRIPVQYAKRIVGNKQYGGVRQYIPLKVNAAGVMPIIFAQALMFVPALLRNIEATSGIGAALSNPQGFWYNMFLAIMIILFTYFYTAITINPKQMAEDMKRNGGFIPGIKPGRKTVEFLDTVMSRITLPGSIFLAFIALLPNIAAVFGVQVGFSQFFGGTSLLILVGVVLDTLQQVESHLLMRHYDGLMKSGRIKGRSRGASM
ncbi:preprotein translocase subunit SecY [Bacteroidota bacterium]